MNRVYFGEIVSEEADILKHFQSSGMSFLHIDSRVRQRDMTPHDGKYYSCLLKLILSTEKLGLPCSWELS